MLINGYQINHLKEKFSKYLTDFLYSVSQWYIVVILMKFDIKRRLLNLRDGMNFFIVWNKILGRNSSSFQSGVAFALFMSCSLFLHEPNFAGLDHISLMSTSMKSEKI